MVAIRRRIGSPCQTHVLSRLPARKGRNPATGEAIKIKARKKVAFRAAKELTDAL
jgi:DNA-binding protein HU-beta